MKTSQYFNKLSRTLASLIIILLNSGCQESKTESSSDPVDPLATFELPPGFKIELIAAEPLIGDPVDMEIDEFGRLYVVEMPGYPLDISGSGKIKILADTNTDGKMDKSMVFAENLVLPSSIMRWKNGIMVTDAPHVIYFEDRDGDGKAEIRDTLLTGFALSNPQHNLNSPVLGLDNWIYLAHEGSISTDTYQKEFGDEGSEIYFPSSPKSPRLGKNANGQAVRFKTDPNQLEMTSGYTQFGHTFDSWGHHLLVGNVNHIFHEVIGQGYLTRNPELTISDATQSLSDHGDAAEVFPITRNPEHQLLTDVGVITSACGLTAYLGGSFPAPYNEKVTFVCEPVSNLIHVDRLKEKGASFTASRMLEHQEFLASTDKKFRPVNLYVGPDGALYVVDYYRQIIEHPEWMGEEVIRSGELYNDIDKGRIYRITSAHAKPADWTSGLSLGWETSEELIKKLSSENIWWRQNAQRLLIDRNDMETIPALSQLISNGDSPMGRLHALWTLEGLGKMKTEIISNALKDTVAGIRENAIRLAELHRKDPKLISALMTLINDPDPKVRFQLLCTLGSIDSQESKMVRNKILFDDMADPWVRVAALSTASSETASLLQAVLENFQADHPSFESLVAQLCTLIGSKGKLVAIQQQIKNATNISNSHPSMRAAILRGLANGMETKEAKIKLSRADEKLLLKTFFDDNADAVRKASLQMIKASGITNDEEAERSIQKAIMMASDKNLSDDKRTGAIEFISVRNPERHATLLQTFLIPQEPLSIQLAALHTLSSIPDTIVCQYLLTRWNSLTPELQDAAVGTFLINIEREGMLLKALESGSIQSTSISWPRQVGMMAQSDIKLRNRSRVLFTKNNIEEVNKTYRNALALKGDEVRGKEIFQQNCSRCHQVRGNGGISLGPDLGTIHNWSAEAIMANTLDPNLSISSGYDLWDIQLKNGESVQGIIATETPVALLIKNNGSMDKTVKRRDIQSLKALHTSIMPIDLVKQINLQQMADLLAFLKKNK